MNAPLLTVRDLHVFYGSSQVVDGMAMEVNPGAAVTLIGRNGMGKSTTLKSIMGIVKPQRGSVILRGRELVGLPEYKIAQAGLGWVPEGRGIFPNLTVRENLVAAASDRHGASNPWTLTSIYAMFPRLQERERNFGTDLSGGEQQMLAIGRALMTNPLLLILDEAAEGLAPLVRAEIWRCIERLKVAGMSLIIVDKNVAPLLRLGDHHYIIEKGRMVWSGTSQELRDRRDIVERYVGI